MSFAGLDGWLRSRAAGDLFSGVVLVRRGGTTVFRGRTAGPPAGGLCRFRWLPGSIPPPSPSCSDDADEEAGEDFEALWADRPCYSVIHTRDWLPQFAHKPAVFPPGEGCRYCNVGYILVGLAIEAVTGTEYRDHVRGAVFGRAGMAGSGFFDRREAVPDVAEGWDPVLDGAGSRTGWKQNIFSYPPIGSPDSGAQVTAADLVRFAQAVRTGRLLSAQLTEQFLTPQALHHERDDWAVWYGFGLEFVTDRAGSVRNTYKTGANAGASGIVRYYPADDLDVVVLSNSERGAWPAIDEIHRLIRTDNPSIGESGDGFR